MQIGMTHDIGHPPFSHTFETALKKQNAGLYSNHEIVGIDLLNMIIKDIETNKLYKRGEFDLASPSVEIAKILLDKTHIHHSRFIGLSEIISSDIDCDRLDYVRRDAQSAGLTTNAYDLGRLYDAMKLSISKDGDNNEFVKLSWTAQALSGIEAFFSVRFHLYRWALWHHASVRQNMALILATTCMQTLSKWNLSYLKEINSDLVDIFDIAVEKKRRGDYWYFTDYYLLDRMAKILNELEKTEHIWTKKPNEHDPKAIKKEWGVVADLYKFLKTFLYRDKTWLASFWKRPDDYEEFSHMIFKEDDGNSRIFNSKMNDYYNRISTQERDDLQNAGEIQFDASTEAGFGKFKSEYGDYLTGRFENAIERKVNIALEMKQCRVRAYYIAKFAPTPRGLMLESNGRVHKIGTLSPSVQALETAWEALPHLWLFLEFYAYEESGDKVDLATIRQNVTPRSVYQGVADAIGGLLALPAASGAQP